MVEVRSSSPPSVHGAGDHGFVAILIGIARERGVSGYIGDGAPTQPGIHPGSDEFSGPRAVVVMVHQQQREVAMPSDTRTQRARDLYLVFAAGDRDVVERILADEFTFSSPLDVGLTREGYFERCWPGAGQGRQFQFVRLAEAWA
jgi:hypothetical protein